MSRVVQVPGHSSLVLETDHPKQGIARVPGGTARGLTPDAVVPESAEPAR